MREEVDAHLERAVAELKHAGNGARTMDEKFAHELARMEFSVAALRLSWNKKHWPWPLLAKP